MFKPMPVLGGQDLASRIEALGGDVNAFTSHDETVFHAVVPAAVAEPALEALLSPVVSPHFEQDHVGREAQVVVEEIRQYNDDPAGRVTQDLLERLFAGHAYGRPVLGRQAEVVAHDAKRVAGFHRRSYTAKNCVLVVVGPVQRAKVLAQADRLLGGLKRGGRSVSLPQPVPPSRPRIQIRRDDVHETHFAVGWVAPALPHPDACALEAVSVVLGYGEASRLSTQTRRREQVVSEARAMFYASRHASTLLVSAATSPRQTQAAIGSVLDAIDELRQIPIDAAELRRARAILQSDLIYRKETVQGQAHALGYYLSLSGDLAAEHRYFAELETLTPARVREACAQWLRPSSAGFSVVLPGPGAAAENSKVRQTIRTKLGGRRGKRRSASVQVDRHGIAAVNLGSGLRLRAIEDRTVPMASGWLVWPGGLRLEQQRDLGASALLAALLTRGCNAVDGDTLAQEIDGSAAVLEGFSGRSSVGLHFECLAPDLPAILRRALQCAIAPTFAPEEFEEERRVGLEDLEAEQDDLASLGNRAALEHLYRGHPYRWRRRGTRASLRRLTPSRLHTLWRRGYPMQRAVVGLCGDFDIPGVVALVEGVLGEYRGGQPAAMPDWPGRPPNYPKRPVETTLKRTKEQAHLTLAFPGLSMFDDRVYALEVLLAVLGGQAGRLFVALREEQGLVYHVSASSVEGIDAGHVSVYAAAGPEHLGLARVALEHELAQVRDQGMTSEELVRAKAWLIGQHEVDMQSRNRVASHLAFDEAYGLGRGLHLSYASRIERVGLKEIGALAREVFDPMRCVTSVVGR